MFLYNQPPFKIYFGDVHDGVTADIYHQLPASTNNLAATFAHLKQSMQLQALVFLKQVHGTQGTIISSMAQAQQMTPFTTEGDYLITNVSRVGLGVMTADCLPVILMDVRNKVVGIAHAGWPGTIGGVVERMLADMQTQFNTKRRDIKASFAASAGVCCYEVSRDFLPKLAQCAWKDEVIQERDGKFYFDVPLFNQRLLESLQITTKTISYEFHACTICHEEYCSYRRQGKSAGRQMTVVSFI